MKCSKNIIHRPITIGNWEVDFFFVKDNYDIDFLLYWLYLRGAGERTLHRAEELMEKGDANCGFTFSNPRQQYAVVVIGPASSGKEFQDTFVHEVYHLAAAIAGDLGVELDGETPAYIAGDAAKELADVVCTLGCRHCH